MEEIFDFFHIDLSGKDVLIKPNMFLGFRPELGSCTSREVIEAALEAALAQGAIVSVGDNTSQVDPITVQDHIKDVVGDHYANIGTESEPRSIGGYDDVPISRKALQADFLINLPKFKTHVVCGITCCVKNLMGLIPGAAKSRIHYQAGHAKTFTRFLVALYDAVRPDLNIVDATVGMGGDGPTHGDLRKIDRLVAGPNGVEVDAVCAAMMGFEPVQIKTLEFAHEAGLGEIELDKIEVVGPFEIIDGFIKPTTYQAYKPVSERKPTSYSTQHDQVYDVWKRLSSIRPQLVEDTCTLCGSCADICAAEAITMDPHPRMEAQKCISCFCCFEVCPEGAWIIPQDETVEQGRGYLAPG